MSILFFTCKIGSKKIFNMFDLFQDFFFAYLGLVMCLKRGGPKIADFDLIWEVGV